MNILKGSGGKDDVRSQREPSVSAQSVTSRLRVQNNSSQRVRVQSNLAFSCPGYSVLQRLVADALDPYATPAVLSLKSTKDMCTVRALLFERDHQIGNDVLNGLIAGGRFEDALLFADSCDQFATANKDFLIVAIVSNAQDLSSTWKLILRLESALIAARLISGQLLH